MSKKMILIAMTSLFLFLTACVKETSYDYKKWNNTRVTSRTTGEVEIPTDYVVDCRHIGDVENVHYYYSVIADPKAELQFGPMGEKQSVYYNVDFAINYFSQDVDSNSSLTKGVAYFPASFKVTETGSGDLVGVVTANEGTIANIQLDYQDDPYFSRIQVGDEIFVVVQNRLSNSFTNHTKLRLPGLEKGNSLECR